MFWKRKLCFLKFYFLIVFIKMGVSSQVVIRRHVALDSRYKENQLSLQNAWSSFSHIVSLAHLLFDQINHKLEDLIFISALWFMAYWKSLTPYIFEQKLYLSSRCSIWWKLPNKSHLLVFVLVFTMKFLRMLWFCSLGDHRCLWQRPKLKN